MSEILPQLIYLALTVFGLGVIVEKHGEPQTGKHNVWTSLLVTGLIWILLYWGGFFDPLFN